MLLHIVKSNSSKGALLFVLDLAFYIRLFDDLRYLLSRNAHLLLPALVLRRRKLSSTQGVRFKPILDDCVSAVDDFVAASIDFKAIAIMVFCDS